MPVLQRALARHGKPRPVEPGVYHLSDLLTRPAETIAAWHRNESAPDGIPAWLAARGLALEDAVLAACDQQYRQPVIRLAVGDDAFIEGHPDLLQPLDTAWELTEVKSQLDHDDEAREDQALNQGLGYVGLLHAGATVRFGKGLDEAFAPRRVAQVNVVLAGLHDAAEQAFPVDQGIAAALAKYLAKKAAAIHAAVGTGGAARLQDFDRAHPPIVQPEYVPAPVAEGEEGAVADATVQAYVALQEAERAYEELRGRWQATLRLDSRPKVRAPGGGTIGLVRKTTLVLQAEEWDARGGAKLAADLAALQKDLEASPLGVRVAELRGRVEALRRECQREEPAPYVRVYPAKGAKA